MLRNQHSARSFAKFAIFALNCFLAAIIIAACGNDDPTPDPSPTPDMPTRVILALDNLDNYVTYVQTTNEYITNQTLIKRDAEIVYSLDLEIQSSTISHVTHTDDQPNISADIRSTISGIERENDVPHDIEYSLLADLRLVNGTLYLQSTHVPEDGTLVVNDPPLGWQILDPDNPPNFDTLDNLAIPSWIAFHVNNAHIVGRMSDWMTANFTSPNSLTSQSTETNIQTGTLQDGTPVDVIRFTGQGLASGVANTIPFLTTTPDGLTVLEAGIQHPSITFTIDGQNRIRSRIISYNLIIENISADLRLGIPPDTRTSIVLTVNIVESYSNINDPLPTVEAPTLPE